MGPPHVRCIGYPTLNAAVGSAQVQIFLKRRKRTLSLNKAGTPHSDYHRRSATHPGQLLGKKTAPAARPGLFLTEDQWARPAPDRWVLRPFSARAGRAGSGSARRWA